MDVDAHITSFNTAVESGAWRPFVDRSASDAVLAFIGPPVGPFVGREAILSAYESDPPDDTIDAIEATVLDGTTTIAFRWRRTGATGTMRVEEAHGLISQLTVSFD